MKNLFHSFALVSCVCLGFGISTADARTCFIVGKCGGLTEHEYIDSVSETKDCKALGYKKTAESCAAEGKIPSGSRCGDYYEGCKCDSAVYKYNVSEIESPYEKAGPECRDENGTHSMYKICQSKYKYLGFVQGSVGSTGVESPSGDNQGGRFKCLWSSIYNVYAYPAEGKDLAGTGIPQGKCVEIDAKSCGIDSAEVLAAKYEKITCDSKYKYVDSELLPAFSIDTTSGFCVTRGVDADDRKYKWGGVKCSGNTTNPPTGETHANGAWKSNCADTETHSSQYDAKVDDVTCHWCYAKGCSDYDGYYDNDKHCKIGLPTDKVCEKETNTSNVGGLTTCYKRVANQTCSTYNLLTKPERDAKANDGRWYTCSESDSHPGCYSCKLNNCLAFLGGDSNAKKTKTAHVGDYNTSAYRYLVNEDEAAAHEYDGVLSEAYGITGASYRPKMQTYTHPTTGEKINCLYSCKRGDYIRQGAGNRCFIEPSRMEGRIYKVTEDQYSKKYYVVYKENDQRSVYDITTECDDDDPIICVWSDCGGRWQLPSPSQLADIATWKNTASSSEQSGIHFDNVSVGDGLYSHNGLDETLMTNDSFWAYSLRNHNCTSCTINDFDSAAEAPNGAYQNGRVVCNKSNYLFYRKIKIIDYSYQTR